METRNVNFFGERDWRRGSTARTGLDRMLILIWINKN